MYNKSYFEFNLDRSETRVSSKPKEIDYVYKYLPNIAKHLLKIKAQNPEITEEEMEKRIFAEIDDYASTVYENSYVFSKYMEYVACQYLRTNSNKYKEISEKLKKSDVDFDSITYNNCTNFDEYLTLYVYNLKKDLFRIIFNGYLENTPDNYKNFDELLQSNMSYISKNFFDEHFTLPEVSEVFNSTELDLNKKINKLKEYSTWYKNPKDRQNFMLYANLFLRGSSVFLSHDQEISEKDLRRDLSVSTASIVSQLDSLGHLDDYMISYVYQMCDLGFPEFATPICKDGKPDKNFAKSVIYIPASVRDKKISEIIDKDKLKTFLSENYLYSNKSMSLESLLALNSFWSNRYIKELDFYSEVMFLAHDFDFIHKIIADEEINVSKDDIHHVLVKMNTFYKSASRFLEEKQEEIDSLSREEIAGSDDKNKIIRFSYDPYIENIANRFGNEYNRYFSSVLPNSKNDIRSDANWYIRLYNPIYSSYSMKNEAINSLLASIENSSSANFPNAGLIPDSISEDGTFASIPISNIGIGIDAGLTSPVRVHIRRDVLVDFLNSVNGHTIIPIYEGANDFNFPSSRKSIPTHLILPMTEKHRNLAKKVFKTSSSYENSHFVSHLCLTDSKHIPDHLKVSKFDARGREKKVFVQRYVDVETGEIYIKENDEFLRVSPEKIVLENSGGGHDEL